MSRTKKFKDNLKKKVKQKAWKTGKKLGKSYLEYKAFTIASSKARKAIFGKNRKSDE